MNDWTGWTPRHRAVLVLVRHGDQVLLIQKKRGLGQGKVNAPGGKLEPGETWYQAAVRETEEETGVVPEALVPRGTLWYQFTDGYALEVVVFTAGGHRGNLRSCDEADPFWHPVATLPWASMWADDGLWVPLVLSDQGFMGRFVFDGDRMAEAWVTLTQGSAIDNNG